MPPSGAGAGLSPRPRLYRRMSVLLSGTPTLPTLLRRIPARFCRRPPLPAPAARDTHALLPAPPPHPRLRQGILRHFPGTPTPPAPSQGYLCTSAGTPTPPAPSQGYPYPSAGIPRPTRAFGAPPPPRRGGGSAHDIRGTAVPGVEPTGSRALDRGDIAFGGEADGEGELVPPPLSPTLQLSYFSSPPLPCLRRDTRTFSTGSPHPARAFAEGYPDTSAGTPLTRACSAPPPPPLGAGQCPGVYQESSRIRGGAGEQPCTLNSRFT